jgi:hypothetical protein
MIRRSSFTRCDGSGPVEFHRRDPAATVICGDQEG